MAATTGCVLNQRHREGDGEGDEGKRVEKRKRLKDGEDGGQREHID